MWHFFLSGPVWSRESERSPAGHADASAVCGDLPVDSPLQCIFFLHVFGMSWRKSKPWSCVLHQISKALCAMTVRAATPAPAIASGTLLPAASMPLCASKLGHKAKQDLLPTHDWEETIRMPW